MIQYRAEQVGSLLRPPELLGVQTAVSEGRATIEQLRVFEDRAIGDALRRQREIGLDILSDGEMRRASWLTDMADAVDGFVPDAVELEWKGPGGGVEVSTARAAGATLHKRRKLTARETPYLKAHAAGPFKITLPAPSNFLVASYKPGVTDQAYPTRGDFLDAVVEIIRDEILWLVDEGVTYIQFDAPYYSHYLDPRQRERMRQTGVDPDLELARAIAGDNAAFQGIARGEVTYALHVCRGNSRSRWYSEGGYDAIAEQLFTTLDVDTFLLEYDDQRSGGFQPLRLMPASKNVVLGLITSKTPELESVDAVRRRIDEASHYLPIEHLALSTQCGFASIAHGNLLTAEDQWRKLTLVVETVEQVWGHR